MKTLIPVSSKSFQENVKIRFNNILDGFDKYLNFEIKGAEKEKPQDALINFLTAVFEANDEECFVDFYLNNLDEETQSNLLKLCASEDREIIKKHIALKHIEPYYKLTHKALIPFLLRLNTHEVFFVTFYFTKRPLTIWGNYEQRFPCFTDNKENLEFYKELAKSYKVK